jgi:lysophospholipase L1-like esterase
LALLVGGGFLIAGQMSDTAQAATDWTIAPQGVNGSDNFDRENGAVGNGWLVGSKPCAISGNKCVVSSLGIAQNQMIKRDVSQINQRVIVDVTRSSTTSRAGVFLRLTSNPDEPFSGYFALMATDGKVHINAYNGSGAASAVVNSAGPISNFDVSHTYRYDFSAVGISPTILSLTVTDLTTNTDTDTVTISASNSTDVLQVISGVGLSGYSGSFSFDNFELYNYNDSNGLEVSSSADNIKFGDTVTYTFAFADEGAISLTNFSDGGAGGTFSPTSISLGDSNPRTATVTYTPAKVGEFEITADVDKVGQEFSSTVTVWPYSTNIGYIGDSITYGQGASGSPSAVQTATTLLGRGVSFTNAGISSSWPSDWGDDTCRTACAGGVQAVTTNAIAKFQAAGVDIVSVMLGSVGRNAPDVYKASMQKLADQLKAAGFKHMIINNAVYNTSHPENYGIMEAYPPLNAELVAENGGFILLGDNGGAFDWFKEQETMSAGSVLLDGTHPNSVGHTKLGEFWAGAIKADLLYQISPNHVWTLGDNSFVLGDSKTLTHSIDKYFGEFSGVVKVDDVELTADEDYTASEGSTVIELLNSYLNTLGAGTYTLSVEFAGGVWVDSTFTISASGVITPTPVNPNAPAVPSGPSVPNTGFNLGKLLKENRGAVLAVISVVIAGLGISIALVTRKLAKES